MFFMKNFHFPTHAFKILIFSKELVSSCKVYETEKQRRFKLTNMCVCVCVCVDIDIDIDI